MIRRLIGWAVCGALGGFLVGGLESARLVLTASHMFFNKSDLSLACVWTILICSTVGLFVAIPMGTFATLFAQLKIRFAFLQSTPKMALAMGAVFVVPIGLVLHQLTSGPQARAIPGRAGWVLGISLGIALGLGGFLSWISTVPRERTRWVRGLATAGLLVALGTYFIDATILVRLYPVFHRTLSLIAVGMAGASLYFWLRLQPKGRRFYESVVALTLLAAVGFGSIRGVRGTQNTRFVIRERTVVTKDVLALVRHILPLPPTILLDAPMPTEPSGQERTSNGPALVRPGANLFLLTVDAMRYDRLKILGATRSIAPSLDALAEQSVVFSRAYTPTPHTSYAISSLMTGKYTSPLFDIPGVPPAHETWPEILHRFRYETVGFYTKAVFFIDRNRFEPYIRSGLGFLYRHVDYRVPAAARADQLLDFLKTRENRDRPLFAWAHFFDPHEPYDADCVRFGTADVDRYDCEIWNVDRAIGRVLAHIRVAYPEAIVMVAADHGEEFDDHGGRYHGTTLYDEQIRVPLMIQIPGVSHRVVDEPVNLVDLLGTGLALLDIPVPARVRSRSLLGWIAGEKAPGRAFAEIPGKKMVVAEGFKLICLDDLDLCELYDLDRDPRERRSITTQQIGVTNRLKAYLQSWTKSHARLELRPIAANDRVEQAWPEVLRRAISGVSIEAADLIPLIERDSRVVVRRKAAEQLYDLWPGRTPPLVSNPPSDPEVLAWLALLRGTRGGVDSPESLGPIAASLNPLTRIGRLFSFFRLEQGNVDALESVVHIATSKAVPHTDRMRAIELIGQRGNRGISKQLHPLIAEYQLTLETARALAALGDVRSIDPLVERLHRERFKDRKSAIIFALVRMGNRRIAPELKTAVDSIAASNGQSNQVAIRCGGEHLSAITSDESPKMLWSNLSKAVEVCDKPVLE